MYGTRRTLEGWHYNALTPTFGDWVAARSRRAPEVRRRLTRISKRDKLDTAQTHIATPPAHNGAKHPALSTGKINNKVKPIAVCITSRPPPRADVNSCK